MVSFHGGPEGQERPSWSPVAQSLVAAGFTVFAPNVRGSGGFGRAFMTADDGPAREASFADVRTTVEQLVAAGIAAPGRIGAHGWSYGGYLTLVALTRWPELFAAGVTLAGMSDLRTFFAGTEPWMAAASVTEYGDPVADREMLAALSPMTDLARLTSPVLLAHGDRDTNVPVAESVQAHQELQALGRAERAAAAARRGAHHRGPRPPRRTERARRRLVRPLAVTRPLFAGYPASPADEAVTPDGLPRERLPRARGRAGTAGDRGPDGRGRRDRRRSGTAAGWPSGRGPTAGRPCGRSRWTRCRGSSPPASGRAWRPGWSSGTARSTPSSPTPTARPDGGAATSTAQPELVRAGVLPEWAVAHSPARHPDAVGQAWPGQPRATVAAVDVLRTPTGDWVAAADHLRGPAGLGYALANRDSARAALPELFDLAAGRPVGRGAGAARRSGGRGTAGLPGEPADRRPHRRGERQRLVRAPGAGRRAGRAAGPRGGPLAARWTAGSRWRWTASGTRSTSSTGGSTTACSAPSGRRSASRWTCCSPRPCGRAGSGWRTCRATGWPTTPPPTPGCPR